MNKYLSHIFVVPEDDADRQVADGFALHHAVKVPRIQVMPVAGDWPNVLKTFKDEYIQTLRRYTEARVVMLIDFDGRIDDRRAEFNKAIPDDLTARVFVVGSKHNPEALKKELKVSFEEIGLSLADDCVADSSEHWNHDQLRHNDAERQRLVQTVKPFLF
jgi:hypothetical protein